MAEGADASTLRAWIEDELDARIVRLRPFAHGGRSRQTWELDVRTTAGADVALILRREVGGGPFTSTSVTLGREASVLRAVHAAGVPSPRVFASSTDGDTIILERLSGTAEFAFPDDAVRRTTIRAFAEIIAGLHLLDVSELELPFGVSTDSADATRTNLAEFFDAYERLCARHKLIEQTYEWLMTHAPSGRPSVLDHGDVGPGNFMHERGVITGVIDWELSHPGDPMDDIAWIWFRTQVLGLGGGVADFHQSYSAVTGEPIDTERVAYFGLAILFRCCVVSHVRQAHDPTGSDIRPAELRAMLSRGLTDMVSGTRMYLPA